MTSIPPLFVLPLNSLDPEEACAKEPCIQQPDEPWLGSNQWARTKEWRRRALGLESYLNKGGGRECRVIRSEEWSEMKEEECREVYM